METTSDNQPDDMVRLSDVFVLFLRQRPPNEIAWRTMSGNFTTAQIADGIERREEIGLQWASDHARVARDILAARQPAPEERSASSPAGFPAPGHIHPLGPCTLISECSPDTILWRTSGRAIPASELRIMVETGSAAGHGWIHQLLLVSHEMIASRGRGVLTNVADLRR